MVMTLEETQKLVDTAVDTAYEKLLAQDYQSVILILEQTRKIDTQNARLLQMLGLAYHSLRKNDMALCVFMECLKAAPDNPETLNNIALCYSKMGEYETAADFLKRAIQIKPGGLCFYNNLALQYRNMRKYHEAIAVLRSALELENDKTAWGLLGGCYGELKDLKTAEACFQEALKIDPNYAPAHVDMASIYHLQGRWLEGFREYEHRFDVYEPLKYWQQIYNPARRWKGENITSKTILVHTEQGHGDAIHFIRYLPLLRQRCSKVVLHCSEVLRELFTGMADEIYSVDPVDIPTWEQREKAVKPHNVPPHDVHAAMISLPHLLGNPLPIMPPYLRATKNFDMSAYKDQFKIGVVWGGNPQHPSDRQRSCKLTMFREISQIPGVKLFSLMKDKRARAYNAEQRVHDLTEGAEDMRLVDMSEHMNNFQDTANIIASLDLILAVDTSTVHLAGALNKPVVCLLPWNPDWRWMIEGEETIWYPSVKLLRQSQHGVWDDVFAKAKEEVLKKMK
jgi:tetratricopeptide (TPR) repeat protein